MSMIKMSTEAKIKMRQFKDLLNIFESGKTKCYSLNVNNVCQNQALNFPDLEMYRMLGKIQTSQPRRLKMSIEAKIKMRQFKDS